MELPGDQSPPRSSNRVAGLASASAIRARFPVKQGKIYSATIGATDYQIDKGSNQAAATSRAAQLKSQA